MQPRYKKFVDYGVSGIFLLTLAVAVGTGIGNNGRPLPQRQPDGAGMTATKVVAKESGKREVWFRVVRMVDGDTFVVVIDGKEEKIRLIGIDTPEVVDPRKPVQCFGKEASRRARELLGNAYVRLEADSTQGDRDKYGRLLRYAFLEDNMFFNENMIKEGYAHEYTYHVPYTYQKRFKAAQAYARKNKKGLWADGVCGDNLR